MDGNRLSLESVFQLRGKAFAEISEHTFAIDAIAAAITDVDAALQTVIADPNIDDQQALVTAARQLWCLMDGGQS